MKIILATLVMLVGQMSMASVTRMICEGHNEVKSFEISIFSNYISYYEYDEDTREGEGEDLLLDLDIDKASYPYVYTQVAASHNKLVSGFALLLAEDGTAVVQLDNYPNDIELKCEWSF